MPNLTCSKIHRNAAPRLNIELREDQFDALRILVPHGHRKHLFQAMTDDLIELLKLAPNRENLIAFVIAKAIRISDFTFKKET